ncbi:MAG TPA: class F sortase [Streptosporangiaceae bacterium]
MSPARFELHHEPPYLDVQVPVHVRVPGLALRIRVPGRKLQRTLAVAVLVLGLGVAASSAAGLVSARPGRPAVYAAPAAAPAPHGRWAAAPSEETVAVQRVPPPVFLTIPAIGVRTRLVRLGLTASGALQAPRSTTVAGWYSGSPRPGAIGSAVIGGHVDSYVGPGIFFRLRLLHRGDRIFIRQGNGRLAVFRVSSVHRYLKSRFPTSAVYGPVPTPQLRLITCGGAFDPARGSYLSNVIVYATLIS